MRTALTTTVTCVVAIAVVGAIGVWAGEPWVFPSLGPTLMVMAETPDAPAAHPLNALVGHGVGIAAGLLSLVLLGLRDHPSAVQEGLTTSRVVAACLALGLTALVLQLARRPHPPAGATTLIVALGILRTTNQLAVMAMSVVLVVALGELARRYGLSSRAS